MTASIQAQRVEGRYDSVQRGNPVQYRLELSRDGRAEMTTTFSRGDRLSDEDRRRFGRSAEYALNRRTIHHTGRWELRRDRIEVRLTSLDVPTFAAEKSNLVFTMVGKILQLDRGDAFYSDERMSLRPYDSMDDDRPGRGDDSRYGWARIDGRRDEIDDIDLSDTSGKAKLVVKVGRRKLEFFGEANRRGDEVTLRVRRRRDDDDPRNVDIYKIRMRGRTPIGISGEGRNGDLRVSFGYDGRPRF